MIYTDLDGNEVSGPVWSAGPITNSVWVLPAAVVDIKTRRQVPYEMPTPGPYLSPERLKWAHEVITSRRHNPLPDWWISCDPELDIAQILWARAIDLDKLALQVRQTRYADRAIISAKRLLALDLEAGEKEQS